MYLAMMRKEIKQFLRSKGDILMMFIFPIVLITTLSVGLKNMMSNSTELFGSGDEYSIVYYTMEEETKYKEGFNAFVSEVKETVNIKFEEVDSLDEIIDKVDNYDAMVHINIDNDGFKVYSSSKGDKLKSKVFRSVFEGILNEYAVYETIGEFNPKAFINLVENKYDEYVIEDTDNKTRDVSSSEYYTFAELALIILFVSQVVAETIYKEKQLTTINRIRLSKVTEGVMIASKISLGIMIAVIQTFLVYAYSSIVLKVDWGEHTIKFLILFIVFGVFASVLGAIIGLISKKDTTISGLLNGLIFFICALGGCYTPLNMIVSVPILNRLMYISPIYWINTATSGMICGLESNAYMIAIAIPTILSIIGLIVTLLIMKNRGGLAND